MKLFYRQLGRGFPLVILHGLYGCSDNWLTIAKQFAQNHNVIIPDLRNHGNSPHSDIFDISSMAEDISELVDDLKLDNFVLMGHSLGGKVALDFATQHSDKLQKLIIVDIAPRTYGSEHFEENENHRQIINILKNIDLSMFANRSEALSELVKLKDGERFKNLMMKNLKSDKNGKLEWKINISAIADNLQDLLNVFNADLTKIKCPTLFVKGDNSSYLLKSDFEEIRIKIANSSLAVIPNSSHWVHVDNPDNFLAIVNNFISK
jgi:pimeloyl-ACP methyl ester carboxylesterase